MKEALAAGKSTDQSPLKIFGLDDDDESEIELKEMFKSKFNGMIQKGENKFEKLKNKLSTSGGKEQGSSLIEEVEEEDIKMPSPKIKSLDQVL